MLSGAHCFCVVYHLHFTEISLFTGKWAKKTYLKHSFFIVLMTSLPPKKSRIRLLLFRFDLTTFQFSHHKLQVFWQEVIYNILQHAMNVLKYLINMSIILYFFTVSSHSISIMYVSLWLEQWPPKESSKWCVCLSLRHTQLKGGAGNINNVSKQKKLRLWTPKLDQCDRLLGQAFDWSKLSGQVVQSSHKYKHMHVLYTHQFTSHKPSLVPRNLLNHVVTTGY